MEDLSILTSVNRCCNGFVVKTATLSDFGAAEFVDFAGVAGRATFASRSEPVIGVWSARRRGTNFNLFLKKFGHWLTKTGFPRCGRSEVAFKDCRSPGLTRFKHFLGDPQ